LSTPSGDSPGWREAEKYFESLASIPKIGKVIHRMNDRSVPVVSIPQTHIAEFEGLRGLLAAWVVFGHILLFSGYTYQDGWFGIVFSPVLGVYAFMMLSGFVITGALNQRQEGWRRFMARRFFRLYPAYVFCLMLAIFCLHLSQFVSSSKLVATFGPHNLERLTDVESQLGTYLAFDMSLLQCLVPKWLYSNAHESFLPPTWSLSTEWLFYTVVPFWIWQLQRNAKLAACTICAFIAFVWLFASQLKDVNQAFHLGNVFHFLTGIGSYYLWKHLPQFRGRLQTAAIIGFWFCALIAIAVLNLPYKIWLLVMVAILYERVHSRRLIFIDWFRLFLTTPQLQFLGKISYSTYLVHWIVIEVCVTV